jgi:anthranilate phosphoribosyltransferase
MRMKGETERELMGFTLAMRERAEKIQAPAGAVDLCGTGGDGFNTFNISTVSSFVVAAAGVPVAKHGNRSVSSRSGSADVLSALGMAVDLEPSYVRKCLDAVGLCFMYAPVFHPSMKHVSTARREMGLRTFFNILGPMTNPAGVENQLIGVYDPELAPAMAKVLIDLGTSHVMLVNGSGMDEITTLGNTKVVEATGGENHAVFEYELSPGMFDLDVARPEDLRGGSPIENARTMLSILKGKQSPGSDIVALNAGAALYVSGRAKTIHEGLDIARDILRSGRAMTKLEDFSKTIRALEVESQLSQNADALCSRRLLPETVAGRAEEVVAAFSKRILKHDAGPGALAYLDWDVIEQPSILSVILLRRMLSLLTTGVPEVKAVSHNHASLSESIASSKGLALIAEYKPSSPSARALSIPPDPERTLRAYTASGACGLSVLVEPDYFSGGPEMFSFFRSRSSLPMLFKDFVVRPEQVEFASRIGADALLLIAKALTPEALGELTAACMSNKIEPLVEIHDAEDLAKLVSSGCMKSVKMIGVNSRDLRSLAIDLGRLETLRKAIPENKLTVAESGLRSQADIPAVRGFDAVLAGSTFMQAQDLEQKVAEIAGACKGVSR